MTSLGLGEMFEGYSADTRGGKYPLVSMGGRAEGLGCADPGARTPIGASRINLLTLTLLLATVTKIPEGFVIVFRNFAGAPNSQTYYDSKQKIIQGTPPTPRTMLYLGA